VKKAKEIKSQAAMEYLMTYGWAILIIALALGVLYSLGIMNPKNFLPRAPPGSCFVFRPNGPGTTDFVSLQGTCGYLPMYVASFNGINSYITIPHSLSLSLSEQTIVFWFTPPIGSGYNWQFPYISKNDGTTRNYYIYGARPGEPIVYEIRDPSNTYHALYGGKANYLRGKWYQFVGTYKPTTGEWKIYIDGQIDGQKTEGFTPGTNTASIVIGGGYFNGSIANVQIYNTALTPQEIQYLYQQGLGGGPIRLQNLVGWWPLNGDAKDYSGNNNHGTINGGVTFVQNYNPP